MSKRVLCKFFAHGACLKGEHCEYSHDWKDPANNVCTFYQKGVCAYGSRCRYEHVKVSRSHSSAPSSSAHPHRYQVSETVACPPGIASAGITPLHGVIEELSASSRPSVPPTNPAWSGSSGHCDFVGDSTVGESRSTNPADLVICSFAAAGNCPRGEKCPHVHGDVCPTCRKECLHPFRPEEREEHMKSCEKKHKHLEALKRSQEIECSVCLERVLSKPSAAERKFGLLSECDHPFCVSCIRNWRSSSPTSGMDVNSALRSCPICRKFSYFVIPSVIWYATKEEKQEIVESYKAKLRSIDCKHFDFGNGICPFGTSCFYKHMVKPGSYLWDATLGLNNCGPSFLDMHEDGSDCAYSFDDADSLGELFHNMYLRDRSVGVEVENDSADDIDDEGIDELANAYLAAEAMSSLQMHFGFEVGGVDESVDDSDGSDADSDYGSFGSDIAHAYLAAEHAYRDGRLEEVVLRHLGAEDGETVIAKDIRLSDFLNSLRIR